MIQTSVRVIGGEEIARQFERGPGAMRAALKGELAEIGDEIVARARGLAPKKSGIMAERILWYFGREATARQRRKLGIGRFGGLDSDFGPVQFTVRPTGSVAHLMERGVNATRKAHVRRNEAQSRAGVIERRRFKRSTRIAFGKTAQGVAFVKAHPFVIAKRPFFVPAVDSVGGASGVNARLQAALTKRAPELMRGAE